MKEWPPRKAIKILCDSPIPYPQLKIQGQPDQQFDIIVAPSVSPITVDGAAQLSSGFYRSVTKNLAAGGLFSQRIPYYDLGPEIVRHIVKRFQLTFPNMLMIESVGGELVLVARNDDQPLITRQILNRLQTPQARSAMSSIGWDWSVSLSRGALAGEKLDEYLNGTEPVELCQLACQLPNEVTRWGQKSTETRAALREHGTSLGALLGDLPEAQDVSQRLEDLQLAQNVLIEQSRSILGLPFRAQKTAQRSPQNRHHSGRRHSTWLASGRSTTQGLPQGIGGSGHNSGSGPPND